MNQNRIPRRPARPPHACHHSTSSGFAPWVRKSLLVLFFVGFIAWALFEFVLVAGF